MIISTRSIDKSNGILKKSLKVCKAKVQKLSEKIPGTINFINQKPSKNCFPKPPPPPGTPKTPHQTPPPPFPLGISLRFRSIAGTALGESMAMVENHQALPLSRRPKTAREVSVWWVRVWWGLGGALGVWWVVFLDTSGFFLFFCSCFVWGKGDPGVPQAKKHWCLRLIGTSDKTALVAQPRKIFGKKALYGEKRTALFQRVVVVAFRLTTTTLKNRPHPRPQTTRPNASLEAPQIS